MATHCSILAWEFPWTERAWQATVHGVAKSRPQLKRLNTHTIDQGHTFYFLPSLIPSVSPCPGPHISQEETTGPVVIIHHDVLASQHGRGKAQLSAVH